jgi:hypothetical protein
LYKLGSMQKTSEAGFPLLLQQRDSQYSIVLLSEFSSLQDYEDSSLAIKPARASSVLVPPELAARFKVAQIGDKFEFPRGDKADDKSTLAAKPLPGHVTPALLKPSGSLRTLRKLHATPATEPPTKKLPPTPEGSSPTARRAYVMQIPRPGPGHRKTVSLPDVVEACRVKEGSNREPRVQKRLAGPDLPTVKESWRENMPDLPSDLPSEDEVDTLPTASKFLLSKTNPPRSRTRDELLQDIVKHTEVCGKSSPTLWHHLLTCLTPLKQAGFFKEEARYLREMSEKLLARRRVLHERLQVYARSTQLARFQASIVTQLGDIQKLDVDICKCVKRSHILECQELQQLEGISRLLEQLHGYV